MLNSILMSSLSWKVLINNVPLSSSEELRFSTGQMICVRVELLNCCGWSIKYLNLMLDCYQDYQNGNRRYNLDLKRGIFGKDRIHIEQLSSKETFVHECSYIFFYAGI